MASVKHFCFCLMDWHNAHVFCGSWRMNPRNFGDSWTFLDLHHDEFVLRGDMSTCWMDNHAIGCFASLALVNSGSPYSFYQFKTSVPRLF